MSDNFDRRSFVPPNSEALTTVDDSADKTGWETPPAKLQKTVAMGKNKAKDVVANKAGKKKQVESDIETVVSATESSQKSKLKKPKTQDEIDLAARKIEVNKKPGSKYGDTVKSMSGKQEEAKSSGKPAPEAPSHQGTVGYKRRWLERKGAMSNMRLFNQEQGIVTETSDQLSKQDSTDPPEKT